MKQLILIAAFLVAAATKMVAQEQKPIEIKKLETSSEANENHHFAIIAHEDLEVNLKFLVKEDGNVKVIVTDSKQKIVAKQHFKKGNNKIDFDMGKEEQYNIQLVAEKPANLVVYVDEN